MEATNAARSTKRNMYVFFEDDQWWFSGQVPKTANDFYVAYPSGQIDGAGRAPEISLADWGEFFERTGERFKPPARPEKKERVKRFSMKAQKKIFIGYSAFAPYLAMAMTMLFCHMFESSLNFGMMFTCILFTIPLSLVFVLVSLHRPKDPKMAMLASTLALDSHCLFYGHLLYVHTIGPANLASFIYTTMVSMTFSGVALLLIWDNEKTLDIPAIKDLIEA